ncbi:T-complex protein 1 subunit alpha [Vitis vinifera]|uniref:T-complex protein 1 subunit alpha n=1 Tax=Vitis vinifera TaxID=29760 RepID=A0A438BW50_VITVI|nr:T-complex protein 1 subunit alpha [Vitis vinifera]
MALSAQTPDIMGERQSGQDVRSQNGSIPLPLFILLQMVACQAVANIVKSSLGPVGLDKDGSGSILILQLFEALDTCPSMLVDDIGDVTITNDGATILKMLEVEHPAAKVLVELAELQDREVGDGTTSVVIVAAELLKRANDLVRNKIHPTSIISGYRLAMREACKYVDEKLAVKVEKLGKDSLINCAKTSMSSKLIAGDSDFFASLVVDAVQAVKTTNARGEVKYPIKGINILKAHGKSAKDSYLLNGYALNTGRAAQGMPLRVAPARIACLDFNLQRTKMQLGVQVLVTDPRELEKIRQRTDNLIHEHLKEWVLGHPSFSYSCWLNVRLEFEGTFRFREAKGIALSKIWIEGMSINVFNLGEEAFSVLLRILEADMTKERIEKLLKAGANVVLTTKGIDDMALKASFCACIGYIFLPFMGMTAHGHIGGGLVLGLLLSSMTLDNPRVVAYNQYFVEAGAIAVRRVRKDDMRHVAKATGATMTKSLSFSNLVVEGDYATVVALVSTFADMEGDETFDSSFLGYADEVVEERIADDDVIMIKGTKTTSGVSLILRGANDYMLDEMDRALHDALSIVKRTLESNTVVAGGGAVEAALSVYLEYLATTLGSREQLAIAEFAESLLIIPKVLAVNAAKDATELVAKLRAYHHTAQTKADKKHLSSMGLDLLKGTVRNNLEAGVIEPAMSKVKILQFATEAAITILRIDDMIKLVKDETQNEED